MKTTSIIAISSLGLMLLAACTGGSPGGQPDVGSNVGGVPTATPTATLQADAASPVVTASVQDPGDQQSPPEPSATPTARPGLEATDPESVNLVSGKPTLLEFFAFW